MTMWKTYNLLLIILCFVITSFGLNRYGFDFTKPCKPNSLVDVECNTCYCNKHGKLDRKWCTEIDCDPKNIALHGYETTTKKLEEIKKNKEECIPGTLVKDDCNVCLCSKEGKINKTCSKSHCSDDTNRIDIKCDPLTYYSADCNFCLCPKDGIKNAFQCTKYSCNSSKKIETTCHPGQFYSDDCNICICPSNGIRKNEACRKDNCAIALDPWRKWNHESSPQNNPIGKSINLCFPGESYMKDCSMCYCSDLGLNSFAMCVDLPCEDNEGIIDRRQSRNLAPGEDNSADFV